MSKETKSLAEQIRERLNANAGKEIAKVFEEGESLLQVSGWVPLKSFFFKASGAEGFPLGHITQLIGETDTGKTTLMMEGGVATQKIGGIFYLIDAENKWSMDRFALMGGIPKDVIVLQPTCLEEAWDMIMGVLKEIQQLRSEGILAPMMIGYDSLPASVPLKFLDQEAGDANVSVEAKINNQAVRKLRALIKETETALVVTNHYYFTVPKTPYERPKLVIKGGGEITFFSLLIIKTEKGEQLTREVKGEKQKIGRMTRYVVEKGHFRGRTTTQNVWVVDVGILETKEEYAEYQKSLRGSL